MAAAHSGLRGVEVVGQDLRLSFDAPVEEAFLRAAASADGAPAPVRAVVDPVDPQAVLVPLPGGPRAATVVDWRVLSQDGHATSGRVTVSAVSSGGVRWSGDADGAGAGDWIAGVGRALVLAGAVLALGLVAFRWVVVVPAWASGGMSPPGGTATAGGFRERAAAALTAAGPGWHAAWGASAVALAVGVPLIAAGTLIAVGGGAADLAELLSDTRVGTGIAVLAVSAAAALALIPPARRTAVAAAPSPGWALAMGLPPAAALGAMSWMGHASSGGDVGLNVGADMVHNWATATWVGGLLGLLALLLPAGRRLEPTDRMRLVAQAVVRFSTLATVSVALLVVTGVYRALAEVGGLGDLLDTGYGLALLAKLGVFAVMLAVGGYNRFVLHPGMERAALGLPGGGPEAAERLARSVRAELALAALVLVAVAVLVSSAPTA